MANCRNYRIWKTTVSQGHASVSLRNETKLLQIEKNQTKSGLLNQHESRERRKLAMAHETERVKKEMGENTLKYKDFLST